MIRVSGEEQPRRTRMDGSTRVRLRGRLCPVPPGRTKLKSDAETVGKIPPVSLLDVSAPSRRLLVLSPVGRVRTRLGDAALRGEGGPGVCMNRQVPTFLCLVSRCLVESRVQTPQTYAGCSHGAGPSPRTPLLRARKGSVRILLVGKEGERR